MDIWKKAHKELYNYNNKYFKRDVDMNGLIY